MKIRNYSALLILITLAWNTSIYAGTSFLDDDMSFEVLFTNPVCNDYEYTSYKQIYSIDSTKLEQKPKNVFCTAFDESASAKRISSPQNKLIEWIKEEETKELFFTYLSFSNRSVAKELCSAIKKNVKVTFIIDNPLYEDTKAKEIVDFTEEERSLLEQAIQYSTDPQSSYQWIKSIPSIQREVKNALRLLDCGKDNPVESQPKLYFRGKTFNLKNNRRMQKIGLAHNKLFIVNPESKKQIKVSFSSGNLSSGTVLHHENWNFIETPAKNYFTQNQLCLMKGMIHKGSAGKDKFINYIQECRRHIETLPLEDIKSFFVPGEGSLAMKSIVKAIEDSDKIEIAAHRFSNTDLINALYKALEKGKIVNMVADDDLYYIDTRYGHSRRNNTPLGSNLYLEAKHVKKLVKAGMKIKYLETNHWNSYSPALRRFFPLLHHNKFIVFSKKIDENYVPTKVFSGAGNFTKVAFKKNFENFYMISVKSALMSYSKQYSKLWNEMSTEQNKLPKLNSAPKVITNDPAKRANL